MPERPHHRHKHDKWRRIPGPSVIDRLGDIWHQVHISTYSRRKAFQKHENYFSVQEARRNIAIIAGILAIGVLGTVAAFSR
ncbi:MAG: hypothetical protein HYW86_01065 [Candidatus Roizmanbacteria bacterium]|nr:MAG: hypothetical protein HYW86_01065 [Candidatus Roizmanbacteria bacterium]